MKHTPGPWRVHQHTHISGELWLSIGFHTHEGTHNPEGRWIGPVAELKYLVAREEEQRANARLMAAAPEMKDALEEALWLLRLIRDSEPEAWDRVLKVQTVNHNTAAMVWDKIKAAIAKAIGVNQ